MTQPIDDNSVVKIVEDNVIVDQVKLSEEERHNLSNELHRDLEDADNDKQGLVNKVIEWRNVINIKPDDANIMSDFQGASNYRDQLTATHIKVISSILKRTLLSNPIFLNDIPFNPKYKKWLNAALDDYLEFNNIIVKLRKLIDLVCQEGVTFAEITDFVDEYYLSSNEVYMEGEIEKFKAKYKTPESLGLQNNQQYNEFVKKMINNIDKLGEAKIAVKQKVVDNKVDIEIRNIDEIYILPWDSSDINNAKGILSKVRKTREELKEAARIGFFDPDAVEIVLKSERSDEDTDNSSYRSTEQTRLGVETEGYDDYFTDIYCGNYLFTLDEEKGAEEFYIYFARDTRQILRIEPYQKILNNRNIVAFSILPEHNQIMSSSLAELLSNVQALVDTFWNQAVDNNHIANVPMYRASTNELHSEGSEFFQAYGSSKLEFSAGRVIISKEPVEQLRTSPLDMGALFNGINMLQRNSETFTGATQGLSGRENPSDPTAPARKTELLTAQSSLRIDDYLKELIPKLNLLGKLFAYRLINNQPRRWKMFSLQFQKDNMPPEGMIGTDYKQNEAAIRPQDLFVTDDDPATKFNTYYTMEDIVIKVRGQSINMNQDSLIRERTVLLQSLIAIPQIGGNPKALAVLVEKYIENFTMVSNEDVDDLLSGIRPQPETNDELLQKAQQTKPVDLPPELREAARKAGIPIEKLLSEQEKNQ